MIYYSQISFYTLGIHSYFYLNSNSSFGILNEKKIFYWVKNLNQTNYKHKKKCLKW